MATTLETTKRDLRRLVDFYTDDFQLDNACFWAEKLLAVDRDDVESRYCWMRTLMLRQQFSMVQAVATTHGDWLRDDPRQLLLAARAMVENGQLNEALALLDTQPKLTSASTASVPTSSTKNSINTSSLCKSVTFEDSCSRLRCSFLKLRGDIALHLQSTQTAALCYAEAQKLDAANIDAIRKLTEIEDVVDMDWVEEAGTSADVNIGAGDAPAIRKPVEGDLMRQVTKRQAMPSIAEATNAPPTKILALGNRGNSRRKIDDVVDYVTKVIEGSSGLAESNSIMKIDESVSDGASDDVATMLATSSDVIIEKVRKNFSLGRYRLCVEPLRRVLFNEPFHETAVLLFASLLTEKGSASELFALATRLANSLPDWDATRYTLACYSYITGQHDRCRQQLSVCDSSALCCSLMAHSFAATGEHDHAMAYYCAAAQLSPSSAYPALYLAQQQMAVNDRDAALVFLGRALRLSVEDPFVLHEFGTHYLQRKWFDEAIKYLRKAAALFGGVDGAEFLTARTLTNLGHALRRYGQPNEALACHKRVLSLRPGCSSTTVFMALCYVDKCDFDEAAGLCQQAIANGVTSEGMVLDLFRRLTMAISLMHSLSPSVAPSEGADENVENETSKFYSTEQCDGFSMEGGHREQKQKLLATSQPSTSRGTTQ